MVAKPAEIRTRAAHRARRLSGQILRGVRDHPLTERKSSGLERDGQ